MPSGIYPRTAKRGGWKLSKETRLLISLRGKGRKHTKESIEKMRLSKLGKKHSPETIKKISESHKGKISNRKGKKASLETRKKMSEAFRGERSSLWRGGVSTINNKVRASLQYRVWRNAVFARDNYRCVWCGLKSNVKRNEKGKLIILNADHIKQFAYYSELRFDVNNGRTLCQTCHITTNNYGNKGRKKAIDYVALKKRYEN